MTSKEGFSVVAFYSTEQRILLRLIETMDLVDKKNRGAARIEQGGLPGRFDDLADIAHARADSGKGMELPAQVPGDNARQRRLANARWPPEDN